MNESLYLLLAAPAGMLWVHIAHRRRDVRRKAADFADAVEIYLNARNRG
jgi:hypothetical protein